MTFNMREFSVRPTSDCVAFIQAAFLEATKASRVTCRDCHRILGLMESVATLLPLARVLKRPFQREVLRRFPPPLVWESSVPAGQWLARTLAPWLNSTWLTSSVPIRPVGPRAYLHTDASRQGWGAHCEQGETSLGSTAVDRAYKLAGAESHSFSSSALSGIPEKQVCGSLLGQHHGACVYSRAGQDNVPVAVSACRANLSVGSPKRYDSVGGIHSGKAECSSGCAQSFVHPPSHRVDDFSQCSAPPMGALGQAASRSLCHAMQRAPSTLFVSSPGPLGPGQERVFDPLVRPHRLRISPSALISKTLEKYLLDRPDHSGLAVAPLVSGIAKSQSRASMATRTVHSKSNSAPNRGSTPRRARPSHQTFTPGYYARRTASTRTTPGCNRSHPCF